MLSAVIPILNEAPSLENVLKNLQQIPSLSYVNFVLNGCHDESLEIITKAKVSFQKNIIQYPNKLGVDIPRAIGAYYALRQSVKGVLFLDGDIGDDIHQNLKRLAYAVLFEHTDIALTNCYPHPAKRFPQAEEVLKARADLNRTLGLFHDLGLASPSHGPLCASKAIIQKCGLTSLAIPPLFLAKACQNKGKIKVAAVLEGKLWYGSPRTDEHNKLISETIIGDCKAAENFYLYQSLDREGHLGYHPYRDFAALQKLMGKDMLADF